MELIDKNLNQLLRDFIQILEGIKENMNTWVKIVRLDNTWYQTPKQNMEKWRKYNTWNEKYIEWDYNRLAAAKEQELRPS